MSSREAVEQKRDDLIAKAQAIRNKKNEDAEKKHKEILAKAQDIYDNQIKSAQAKYDEFIAKVDEDTGKRLAIVTQVIAAESEERIYNETKAQREEDAKKQEAAEQKLREETEALRKKEEDKKKRIAAKKAAKAKKKEMELRAKVPIPPGFVPVKDSKKLASKLKKLSSAGRYSFCCFYGKKDKKFKAHIEELSAEFNTNVAWFDCKIQDLNFEAAMLLYEFNATPAVVICKEGTPSNLHRYVIGHNDDSKATLRRYADAADKE